MIQNGIKTRVVGVDISLERTSIGIVDIRGNIIATDCFVTSEHPYIGDYVSVLCEHILNLVEQNGGYETIRSVGICSPSGNYRTHSIENAPNMPWKGIVPLAAMLRDRLTVWEWLWRWPTTPMRWRLASRPSVQLTVCATLPLFL